MDKIDFKDKLNLSFKPRSSFFDFDIISKEKLLIISYELQFVELILKFDYIRFLGEKIWGRRIQEGDINLPYYVETYTNPEHLKFLGSGKIFESNILKKNVKSQAERMNSYESNVHEKNLYLIFLDHEKNFVKLTIENFNLEEFVQKIDKKSEFLESLYSILNKKNIAHKSSDEDNTSKNISNKFILIEVSFVSSIKNKGKNLISRIFNEILSTKDSNEFLLSHEKRIENNIELFNKNNESQQQAEGSFFVATVDPLNVGLRNALKKAGFEFLDLGNEGVSVKTYGNRNRLFCIKEIESINNSKAQNNHINILN